MKGTEELARMDENENLRKAILNKYETYRLLDPYRFPAIELNTSRANYEPLRKSFEEEFYVKRGISRLSNNLHIPSANTLSFIFNDDTYLPSRRILTTCQSYAAIEPEQDFANPDPPQINTSPQRSTSVRKASFLGLLVLLGFSLFLILNYTTGKSAERLTIDDLYQNQTVPRHFIIEGNAPPSDTVWIVIHPIGLGKSEASSKNWKEYYLRDPVLADKSGKWKCEVVIGRIGTEDIGGRFQIRAFMYLRKKDQIKVNSDTQVLSSWPTAELSTGVLEVIRGAEVLESPPY
jgi:hypothetical protein